MTPENVRKALLFLQDYEQRLDERTSLDQITVPLDEITLHYRDAEHFNIDLLGEDHQLATDMVIAIKAVLQVSIDRTRDKLIALGVEL